MLALLLSVFKRLALLLGVLIECSATVVFLSGNALLLLCLIQNDELYFGKLSYLAIDACHAFVTDIL